MSMHMDACVCMCMCVNVCVHVDIVLVCSFVSLTSYTHIGLNGLIFGQAGLTIDWNWTSQAREVFVHIHVRCFVSVCMHVCMWYMSGVCICVFLCFYNISACY